MIIRAFETKLTAFEIYEIFHKDSCSFFLDSGRDEKKLGRYSFIGSEPFLVFKSKGRQIEVKDIAETTHYVDDPFNKMAELLAEYKLEHDEQIPFTGGAVGYFAYDLCHHIEKLPRTAVDDVNIPDAFFGFYDGIIAIDHLENCAYAIAHGIKGEAEKIVEALIVRVISGTPNNWIITPYSIEENGLLQPNLTKEQYIKAIERVKEYIKAGDIYQANFTHRFQCDIKKSPLEIYKKLRTINPAPFAAYLDFEEVQILSSSPERFIKIADRQIETRPIKGTCPRGKTQEEDEQNRHMLLNSEKDKAELLMIVDLERNDLGKISETGSVAVTELFHLEEYATVYHLVSTVIGRVEERYSVMDCIKATFPGGSITGAPKIRAMEIIDELEPTQRNIYTGCIGYIGFDGWTDLNIVIRTIVIKEDKAYFQVGGGIVWDSEPEAEYQETLDKAKALIKALQA